MNQEEKLKKEARELLTGGKTTLPSEKKIIYDEKAKQFSIKIPRDIASAAQLNPGSEIKLVVNPSEQEIEEAQRSHFIIYGKEKQAKK